MFLRANKYYPEEAAAIGRLLAGYTELEFGLMACIAGVRDDFDSVFKALFRTRGETQRLDIGDALGRQLFHAIKLGTEFEMAIGSLRHALKIRNQYAHSHWHITEKELGFVDLEEVAKQNKPADGESPFTYRKLSPKLIVRQESFFDYTDMLILWLEHEAKVRREKSPKNQYEKPKQEEPPPLYMPQG
jgi:hypothetical protein